MIDREKVLAVLAHRFPHAEADARAAAANAILGLEEEWEDVTCSDVCYITQQSETGDSFRVFRRRVPDTTDHIRRDTRR